MGFPWLSSPKINQHCSKWQPLLPGIITFEHLSKSAKSLISVVPKYELCLAHAMWGQLAECVTEAHMYLHNVPIFSSLNMSA